MPRIGQSMLRVGYNNAIGITIIIINGDRNANGSGINGDRIGSNSGGRSNSIGLTERVIAVRVLSNCLKLLSSMGSNVIYLRLIVCNENGYFL